MSTFNFAKGINVQIRRQTVATRPGVRVIPYLFQDSVAEEFPALNLQGAQYYNPARGLGLLQISQNDSGYILVAAAGRKFSLLYQEAGADKRMVVVDETGVEPSREDLQLVWWEQAENYALAADGYGSVWIWDGATEARYSVGFNSNPGEGETSEIPTGVSVMVYSNGRLWVVVNGRQVLAGDIIHGANQTSAADVLKFTEQGYFAEGQYFLPPTAMGDIVAAEILPIQDTAQGQGDAMFHTADGGIFSLQTNVYPRTDWANTRMINMFLPNVSASGPYAVDAWNGDQYFRSDFGIQSIRSARAEAQIFGSPHRPVSEGVAVWLDHDALEELRFCSLSMWVDAERLLCTTQPVTALSGHGHRGIVVLNLDPVDAATPTPAWEGLWTFHPELKYPVQMIHGRFRNVRKEFLLSCGSDGLTRVGEFDPLLTQDLLEDGTAVPIPCQVETRESVGGDIRAPKQWTGGRIYFRRAFGPLKWRVEVRTEKERCWALWREGRIDRVEPCPDLCGILEAQSISASYELGKLPEKYQVSRKLQARISWEGCVELELLKVKYGMSAGDSTFNSKSFERTVCEFVCCDEQDFHYPDGVELFEEDE